MSGRHARKAPVVISRALATLVASAMLLALGVAAMTVFTGGERPASGGPRARAPHVVTGPTAPTPGSTLTTRGGPSRQPSEGTSGAVGGEVMGIGGAGGADGGAGTAGPTSPTQVAAVPVMETEPGTTSTGSAPVVPPLVPPVVGSTARGWVQRSDNGRAHGKAVGLLRPDPHGCRRVPTTLTPLAARAEPHACR